MNNMLLKECRRTVPVRSGHLNDVIQDLLSLLEADSQKDCQTDSSTQTLHPVVHFQRFSVDTEKVFMHECLSSMWNIQEIFLLVRYFSKSFRHCSEITRGKLYHFVKIEYISEFIPKPIYNMLSAVAENIYVMSLTCSLYSQTQLQFHRSSTTFEEHYD